MNCANCGVSLGWPYRFYYGSAKTHGPYSTLEGKVVTQYEYKFTSAHDVELCDSCVKKQLRRELLTKKLFPVSATITILFVIGIVLFPVVQNAVRNYPIQTLVTILIIFLVYCSYILIRSLSPQVRKEAGELLAILVYKKKKLLTIHDIDDAGFTETAYNNIVHYRPRPFLGIGYKLDVKKDDFHDIPKQASENSTEEIHDTSKQASENSTEEIKERIIICPSCSQSETIPENKLSDVTFYSKFQVKIKSEFRFQEISLLCRNCNNQFIRRYRK